MKNQRSWIALTVLLLAVCTTRAWADVYLENRETLGGAKNAASQAWVSDLALRVDVQDRGHNLSYVYLRDLQRLRIIDHSAKTYRELGYVQLQGEQARGYDIVPTLFSRLGEFTPINTRLCRFYQGLKHDKKTADVWTVDPRQLALSSDAYKTLQEARPFLQNYAPELAAFFNAGSRAWEATDGYSGVLVKRTVYDSKGRPVQNLELGRAEERAADPSLYQTPAGYKKTS